MYLYSRPLSLRQANAAVSLWHRHHKLVAGMRFAIGAYRQSQLVGACIVGRPVSREVDQWLIAEVIRVSTDGSKNVCSFLYGKATRICKEMGFDELWTYTLLDESGSSLRALKQLGWNCDGVVRADGVGWNNRENRRTDQPTGPKKRWRVVFTKNSRRTALLNLMRTR